MDVSNKHMQDLMDQKKWPEVMNLYMKEAEAKSRGGDSDAAGFLMTHALVYAYLAGDNTSSTKLEIELKAMGRF